MSTFKSDISNLDARVFYVTSFISSLASGAIGPLMVVYLLSVGLNPLQIGMVLAGGRIAIMLFEFPTGTFADRYGRKLSVLVAFALSSLVLVGWFFSTTFVQWLAFSALFGIAFTFQSGAKESLMLDSLKIADDDAKRNYVYVRVGSWGNVGFVVGGLVAAGLALFWLPSIWLAAAVCNVALFFMFLVWVKEPKLTGISNVPVGSIQMHSTPWSGKLVLHIQSLADIGRGAIRAVMASKALLKMFGVVMLFSLVIALYGLAYPIYLKQLFSLPNYMFGLLGAVFGLTGILGMLFGEKMVKYRGSFFALRAFVILLSVLFIILGFFQMIAVVLLLLVTIEMLIYGWYPVYQSLFNKYVPNAMRASVLSLQSIAILMATAVGEMLSGRLIQFSSSFQVILYGGLLLLPILALLAGDQVSDKRS